MLLDEHFPLENPFLPMINDNDDDEEKENDKDDCNDFDRILVNEVFRIGNVSWTGLKLD